MDLKLAYGKFATLLFLIRTPIIHRVNGNYLILKIGMNIFSWKLQGWNGSYVLGNTENKRTVKRSNILYLWDIFKNLNRD